ncbi:MAG: hypothetical protein JHC87_01510 [Thermoleophilaceae bacterium]|nr:hypothetical protein [Thermoleophilaceae bacterium]
MPKHKTHHIDPKHDFYPLVLVPGDPARAMAIATAQLEEPRMFSHRRGLWGYSGRTPVTDIGGGTGFVVQSTGMGGPSAAIICEELAMLGAEVLLRVGTCGAIDPNLQAGDIVVVDQARCDDGTSQALGAGHYISADGPLTQALFKQVASLGGERGTHRGRIASVDLFYDPEAGEREKRLLRDGCLAVEMEAATVFAVAARHGMKAACVLAVTDELHHPERPRLTHDKIVELGDLIGGVAVRAVESLFSTANPDA